jgi:plasmid stabilization system protein ParE
MKRRVVFRRGVRSEIVAARNWYERQREGLGDEFIECIEAALDWIGRMPSAAPLIFEDIRGKLVERFPYAIYFRVKPKMIRVLAVVHTSRDPAVWKTRK